jgi:hypothetical protein
MLLSLTEKEASYSMRANPSLLLCIAISSAVTSLSPTMCNAADNPAANASSKQCRIQKSDFWTQRIESPDGTVLDILPAETQGASSFRLTRKGAVLAEGQLSTSASEATVRFYNLDGTEIAGYFSRERRGKRASVKVSVAGTTVVDAVLDGPQADDLGRRAQQALDKKDSGELRAVRDEVAKLLRSEKACRKLARAKAGDQLLREMAGLLAKQPSSLEGPAALIRATVTTAAPDIWSEQSTTVAGSKIMTTALASTESDPCGCSDLYVALLLGCEGIWSWCMPPECDPESYWPSYCYSDYVYCFALYGQCLATAYQVVQWCLNQCAPPCVPHGCPPDAPPGYYSDGCGHQMWCGPV